MLDSLIFQKAFKKLKSNIYYDKTNLPLRNKIVDFEFNCGEKLDEYLDELRELLINGGGKWETLTQNILSSVKCIILPKSLKHNDRGSDLITNFNSTSEIEVDKYQVFIDMNIEGHLLGMIWLFLLGWKLDEQMNCCYGNRIRSKLRNEFSEEITFSPYLFEPYFEKYESWRDTALQLAEAQLNKNNDVLVITLDFERFYYSVDITQSFMENLLDKAYETANIGDYELLSRINDLIYKIIIHYSEQYNNFFPEEDRGNILPIGFLPSNVIANWCLKPFDDALINGWNPLYYGRYVDDILIVEKVEKNSAVYKKASEGTLTVDDIITYYLVKENRWNGFDNSAKEKAIFDRKPVSSNADSDSKEPLLANKKVGKRKSYEYSVILDIIRPLGEKTKIKVQSSKAKVFYFKSGQTDALLSCFRDNISKNKSEFRRMPEDDAVFLNDDYSEIFELKQNGINKFREVSGVTLDKYGLSKYLGKYQRVSGLVNDKLESKFIKDIRKIFDSRIIIENYTFWEKVLTILFVNESFSSFVAFVNSIIQAIDLIKIDNSRISINLKESLMKFLASAISRAFSLRKCPDLSDSFKHLLSNQTFTDFLINNSINLFDYANKYFITHMTDKSMCILLPDIIDYAYNQMSEKANDKSTLYDIKLYSLSDIVKLIEQCDFKDGDFLSNTDYKYYPYLITMYDLSITYQYICMLQGKFSKDQKQITNMLNKIYAQMNYQCTDKRCKALPVSAYKISEKHDINKEDFEIIKIKSKKLNKVRVAVSTIKMDGSNFQNIIKGKPNRRYDRYQQISYLINTAIQQRANLLVMPEACLPIEWLATVARTCAKNNMAVITGIEHVIINNEVYNLTAVILPFEDENYRCAHIVFHSKNHFAPDEIRQIEGYRLKAMDFNALKKKCQYELYSWNDFWFSVYCCYELTSIVDRSIFQAYVDAIIAVEWNHDVNYYSNILESLSRDLHCYCIQVNTCDYGDSRITKPAKTELKDILRTKGGEEASVLVGTIDIAALRDFQIKEYELQRDDNRFKSTPPQFNKSVASKKIRSEL